MLRRTISNALHYVATVPAAVLLSAFLVAIPVGVFALSVVDVFGSKAHADSPITRNDAMATMAVLSPAQTFIAKQVAFADTEVETLDETALVPVIGPKGTSADVIEEDTAGSISIHHVQSGETIEQIAKMYGVKTSTIRVANSIAAKAGIKPGQDLLILPVDGAQYKVQKGDTVRSIAKKFGGKNMTEADLESAMSDIAIYNDIETDSVLKAGTELVIPGAELATVTTTAKTTTKGSSKMTSLPAAKGGKYQGGKDYFKRAWGGVQTQGFHDKYRAKDYGIPIGSKIGAAAAGTVIAACKGWCGGYGNVITLSHDNGTQTLYAHLSQINVTQGQQVQQFETIGLSGSTGRSTGPHLHFEIRGGWGDIPF